VKLRNVIVLAAALAALLTACGGSSANSSPDARFKDYLSDFGLEPTSESLFVAEIEAAKQFCITLEQNELATARYALTGLAYDIGTENAAAFAVASVLAYCPEQENKTRNLFNDGEF
jgi:hypothetical protein